jgi:phosphoribosylglycinamide formyltransferase 1
LTKHSKPRLAIFASGSGTNAEAIIQHSKQSSSFEVALVVCNNSKAGVIAKSIVLHTPVLVISNHHCSNDHLLEYLNRWDVDAIALAGYLRLIPQNVIKAYDRKIVNIHPALLPDFGGQGMFGLRVHEAVIKSGKNKSGITIHEVQKEYDKGDILLQKECEVLKTDTPEILANRIHRLEHKYYPLFLSDWLAKF